MIKHIKKLTVLLFVAATMFTFTSCNKDNNNPSGGGSGEPSVQGRLYGTSWTKSYEWFDDLGSTFNQMKSKATLHFITNTTGERVIKTDRYDYTGTTLIQHDPNEVKPFTYVYRGDDSQYGPGVLYWENGDSNTFNINSLYGGRDNIITNEDDFPDNDFPVYYLDE